MFTTADLDKMYRNDEWLGFGYLGERRNHTDAEVEAADAKALEDANNNSLTAEELFDWANSKDGRWYGDCMFGNNGNHADRYLPSKHVGLS
jgi:hypothetical protein